MSGRREEWGISPVTLSDLPAPLLDYEMCTEPEEIAEWLFGDYEVVCEPVVLASVTWDTSDEDGYASPGGSESGGAFLAAWEAQYWFIQLNGSDKELDPVPAQSDEDAVLRFVRGFVNADDKNATVYLRGRAARAGKGRQARPSE